MVSMKKQSEEQTYQTIRGFVVNAQRQVRIAVNSAMVEAYWRIGEAIFKECGDNDRVAYGKQVLQFISERLTAEFGAGFTERNLRNMRQFYLLFPIRHTLCAELSWSHYRVLMRIQDKETREYYASECAKSAWSVRQLRTENYDITNTYMLCVFVL